MGGETSLPQEHVRAVLRFGISEILKRHGLFALHAAAVETGGKAVLIPGGSGSGKTTTMLALVRAGYRCLSDDHPLLEDRPGDPPVLPFLTDVGVLEATARLFPEVEKSWNRETDGADDPGGAGGDKRRFRLDELLPAAVPSVRGTPARAILFPEVEAAAATRLLPLRRSEALERLIDCAMLTPHPVLARRHFELLARVVAGASCHRIVLGRDMRTLPDRVAGILQAAEPLQAVR